ncbi:MAG: hypothetical protein M3355_00595 [Actinomycetota bacterium]|nr:hypothetical protein [Actinomycetota bacterium]
MAGTPEIVRVSDDGLLPLIARLPGNPPRLLLKAGRVGGAEGERGSLAISDRDVDLALDAALASGAEWEGDPDLGVDLLVSEVPGVDQGLLVPRFLYRRSDRIYEYAAAMPAVLREYEAVLRA